LTIYLAADIYIATISSSVPRVCPEELRAAVEAVRKSELSGVSLPSMTRWSDLLKAQWVKYDFRMNDETAIRIQEIAHQEFPGCIVEFSDNDKLIITSTEGDILNTKSPPPGWIWNLSTDQAIRNMLNWICPRPDSPAN
jgi:hypothetical protein